MLKNTKKETYWKYMYKTQNKKTLCVVYYACSRVSDVQNYAGNLSQSIQPYLYTCKCLSHNTNKITSMGHQMELYPGNPFYKHWNVTLFMQFVWVDCFSDHGFNHWAFVWSILRLCHVQCNCYHFVFSLILHLCDVYHVIKHACMDTILYAGTFMNDQIDTVFIALRLTLHC